MPGTHANFRRRRRRRRHRRRRRRRRRCCRRHCQCHHHRHHNHQHHQLQHTDLIAYIRMLFIRAVIWISKFHPSSVILAREVLSRLAVGVEGHPTGLANQRRYLVRFTSDVQVCWPFHIDRYFFFRGLHVKLLFADDIRLTPWVHPSSFNGRYILQAAGRRLWVGIPSEVSALVFNRIGIWIQCDGFQRHMIRFNISLFTHGNTSIDIIRVNINFVWSISNKHVS